LERTQVLIARLQQASPLAVMVRGYMQYLKIIILIITLTFISVDTVFAQIDNKRDNLIQKVQKLSDILMTAEKNDDTKNFLTLYEENAISMPDYQPMLRGIDEISIYYKEIFQRQRIKSFQKKIEEVINLGKTTIVEIGTFKKEYTVLETDSILTLNGKYCYVWNIQPGGSLKIKGEISGFFHPVKNPKNLVVSLQTHLGESEIHKENETPIELRAYNALMEKYVKNGEGALRSQFFTNDGKFMPFAHPTLTGMNELKPYLIAYDTRGTDFKFDLLSVYTYDYEYFDEYILEYPKFKVKWSTPNALGVVEGKGIRIWKRQDDKSLKLYLEISTHNL
jgi:ketosteroid isomerase-like protein